MGMWIDNNTVWILAENRHLARLEGTPTQGRQGPRNVPEHRDQPVFQRSTSDAFALAFAYFFPLTFIQYPADTGCLFYSVSFPGFRVLIADARPLSHIRFMGHLLRPFQSSTSHGLSLE